MVDTRRYTTFARRQSEIEQMINKYKYKYLETPPFAGDIEEEEGTPGLPFNIPPEYADWLAINRQPRRGGGSTGWGESSNRIGMRPQPPKPIEYGPSQPITYMNEPEVYGEPPQIEPEINVRDLPIEIIEAVKKVWPEYDPYEAVKPAISNPSAFLDMVRKKGKTADTVNLIKSLNPGITQDGLNIIFSKNKDEFRKSYFKVMGWEFSRPGIYDPDRDYKDELFSKNLAQADREFSSFNPSWFNRPLTGKGVSAGTMGTVMPWELSPSEVINAPETMLAMSIVPQILPAGQFITRAAQAGRAIDTAANTLWGAGSIGSTYANRESLSPLEQLMGYGFGALGAAPGANALAKEAKPAIKKAGQTITQNASKAVEVVKPIARELAMSETGGLQMPDGGLPIGTKVIDYGLDARKYTITKYEMDADGKWVAFGKSDVGPEVRLTENIDPVSVEPKLRRLNTLLPEESKSQEMAPGTTVQTGLPGIGPEATQSRMFDEANTAAGQGGIKKALTEAPETIPENQGKLQKVTNQSFDLTHNREDSSYWGNVISSIIKDPRNITSDEWVKIQPVYDYLTPSNLGDKFWRNAIASAKARAIEKGIIKTGPGERTPGKRQYTAGDSLIDPTSRGNPQDVSPSATGQGPVPKKARVNIPTSEKPEYSLANFKKTLKAILDDYKEEHEIINQNKNKRPDSRDQQYDVSRQKYLDQVIPVLEEISKNPAEYYPVLKTKYPRLYQLIDDYGLEIGTIPSSEYAHILEPKEVEYLRVLQKEYKLPESLIKKIEKASAQGDGFTLEQLRQKAQVDDMRDLDKFLDDLINPPDVYPYELDQAADIKPPINEIDITNLEVRVEAKYGNLPDIEGATEWTSIVDDMQANPDDLDKYLSTLTPAALKKEITLIEATIGDMSGELLTTLRYESIVDGKAIEQYMDSILSVIEKYREKLKLPKIVDLKSSVLKPQPVVKGEKLSYPVDEIKVDPQRFQFKQNVDTKTGTTGKFEETKWNPKLANLVYGWMDKSGQIWIVNGHHRLDLAKRSGAKNIRILIDKEVEGVTAEQARANGALMNIAEDQGTPLDVAKFLKDSGKDIGYLKEFGISVNGRLASRGIALSQLDDSLFRKVINSQLDEDSAVAIGAGLPGDFANQREVAKLATSKNLSPKELSALIKEAKYAGSTKVTQATLFGETVEEKSLLLARAKLRAWIEEELARDRRLFGFVTSKGRPEALSKGGTQVDIEKGTDLATQSATAQTIFQARVNAVGPINDIMNDTATQIVRGGDFDAVKREALNRIRDTISAGRSGESSSNIAHAAGPVLQPESIPETVKPAEQTAKQVESVKPPGETPKPAGAVNPPKSTPLSATPAKPQEIAKPAGVSPDEAARARSYLEKNSAGATQGNIIPEPPPEPKPGIEPIEAKGGSGEQAGKAFQDLNNPSEAKPAQPPTFESAHAGIVGDMQALSKRLNYEIQQYKASLRGLKGDEAKAARLSIDLLEKELKNIDKIMQMTAEKARLSTPNTNMLRQMISTQKWFKGIPDQQYREIKMRAAGMEHLTEMTEPQLQKVLDAITQVRPVKIGNKEVITAKTENALQALNQSLLDQGKITSKTLSEIQHYLKLPADRYISGRLFISETEGKQLIKALNQEAETGLTEWKSKVNFAMLKSPSLKKAYDSLVARLEKGYSARKTGVSPFWDMGKYMYKLQERTKSQLGDLWKRAYDRYLENGVVLSNMDRELETTVPGFQKIARDKAALQRINDYIASKNKWMDVEYPRGITPDEIKIAQKIEQQLLGFTDDVRFRRVYDAYHEFDGNPQLMATKLKDAPIEDLKEAVEIYETRGADGLAKYLKTKTWGIIESGYEPHIVTNPKLELRPVKEAVLNKGRLRGREGVEFDPADRNILQRRETYVKQMLNLNLEAYLKAMDREFQRISPRLHNAGAVGNQISQAINELKGFTPKHPILQWVNRAQGYVFSVLALSPHMSFRNSLQNFLHPDLLAFINPGNRKLTEVEKRFFDAFISQEGGVTRDYLMQEGMGNNRLSRFVQKMSYYGKAETFINRLPSYWASLNKAERAIKQYKKTGNIDDFIKGSGLNELTLPEQKNVLELLAQDSVDYGIDGLKGITGDQAAAMETARGITEKTHFNYIRAGRAPVEQGETGRSLLSLATYPRNIATRLYEDALKIKNGTAAEKMRAIKSITSFIAFATVADYVYSKATGKDQAQYNPLQVLTYTPGGLAVGVAQDMGSALKDIYQAATGDKGAQSRVAGDITRLGDMFIPFYRSANDILDLTLSRKNADREGINKVRSLLDKQYKSNPNTYRQERTWYQMVQKALFGGGDQGIPEKEEESAVPEVEPKTKPPSPSPGRYKYKYR